MRLHCFHGFLGSENDFSFLQDRYDILTYDMAKLCSGTKEDALASLNISREDAILGYSFGARFALGAMDRYRPKKLIMLAGHAGLDEAQKEARRKIEAAFIAKVRELSFEAFLEYWNALSLFAYDRPIESKPINKSVMTNMFTEFALSAQKNYREMLLEEREKVLWVCGSLDEKYHSYTKEFIEPLGIHCEYIKAGHRLLQERDSVSKIVEKFLGETC